jgi:UDP-3-O-[3-hydroxymyristoyl] glucosamine N-acyltransferase
MTPVRLIDIQQALGGELIGPPELPVERIAPLASADARSISFVSQARYRSQLGGSAAGCVIVSPELRDDAVQRGAAIVADDPYLYYARLTQWWAARQRPQAPGERHASAQVAPDATLEAGVSIGPLAVIEPGARIGAGARVGAHCFVGAGVEVGAGTVLAPRVTLMHGVRLGRRCLLHSGVVIGADGFGFARSAQGWEKIEQLGGVQVGDDVEIGANTCVDRGALDDTVIEDGVKLDNLVQIGHNVRVGAQTAMAGCVGVAGSARIGRRCTIGGGAVVLGHLELADDVHISAASVVTRSIARPGVYSGVFPLDDNAAWEKNAATLRQLHALRERLRALEKKTG